MTRTPDPRLMQAEDLDNASERDVAVEIIRRRAVAVDPGAEVLVKPTEYYPEGYGPMVRLRDGQRAWDYVIGWPVVDDLVRRRDPAETISKRLSGERLPVDFWERLAFEFVVDRAVDGMITSTIRNGQAKLRQAALQAMNDARAEAGLAPLPAPREVQP